MRNIHYYNSPAGVLKIEMKGGSVVGISIAEKAEDTAGSLPATVSAELDEYFSGARREFSFPVTMQGTEFQKKVWKELQLIPYGSTATYGQIAARTGNPRASRAVGMACNRNPLWIVIPCHRVVGSNHHLTGYAGGISMKRALLELEQYP